VSAGRGSRGAGRAAAIFTCAVLAALAVAPAGHASGKPKLVFLKARVISDGIVTPGQLETIAVYQLPPRASVRVLIQPPPTTPECGQFYFCDPVRTSPAPGSPPYRTSGKGRALLTFVMPSTYFVETDPFRPKEGRLQTFANGQAVHIDVDGARLHKHVRRVGFGFSRAVVQLAPSA
jgi:hypothetical protein